jgi:NAD(P)-dependent dehydrogenase (short-subunit alcohol dehydrogenase family)
MAKKIVIITGHAGAIGGSITKIFSQANYHTIGLDQSASAVADTNITCNLKKIATDSKVQNQLKEQILNFIPPKSEVTLINNAGIQIIKPFTKLHSKHLSESLDVNCVAPFVLVKMIAELDNVELQTVINISSIHRQLSKIDFLAYAVSKSALSGLTRSLSLEIGKTTRVCEIQPAAIETPMLKDGFNRNAYGLEALKSMHPTNTIGQPQDVAKLALTIAEQPTAFINGCVINLDGGISNRLCDPS